MIANGTFALRGASDGFFDHGVFMSALTSQAVGLPPRFGRSERVAETARRLTVWEAEAVAAGRVIDLGIVAPLGLPLREDADRAAALIEEGLIDWPWSSEPFLFIARLVGGSDVGIRDHDVGLLVVPQPGERGKVMVAMLGALDPTALGVTCIFECAPMAPGEGIGVEPWFDEDHETRDYMRGSAAFLGVALLAISTGGIPVEQLPAKAQGRRRRPALWRLASGWWSTIGRRERAAAHGGSGTHASPTIHHRRGHVRQLADGRRLWVKDCFVGLGHDGAPSLVERVRAGLRLARAVE